jgi:hypothetical protein
MKNRFLRVRGSGWKKRRFGHGLNNDRREGIRRCVMRAKCIPEFHDCLRKAGIDEVQFIKILKRLIQENEGKTKCPEMDQIISVSELTLNGQNHCTT